MDRQIDYEPRPQVARMKSFNAEEGFYCYDSKWAVGKLPMNTRDEYICSKYFKTNDSLDTWTNGKQEWYLRFFIGNEPSIGILRSVDPEDDQEIPVVARVKLINTTKRVSEFTSSASFLLAHEEWYHDWSIPDEDAKKLSNTDDYVLHCYMDIPKKYDGLFNHGQNSGTALLSSSLARSFEKVRIKNGDPTSDIELVIKDGSDEEPRFYCHRLILAARSPVFEMMFTNDRFKESNERIVEIEDMDGDTLKMVLEYLYTGQTGTKLRKATDKQMVLSLLNAAEKYMLPELKDECALALIGFGDAACDDGEWIEHLQLAEKFNLEYLRKVCILALSSNMRSLDEEQRGLVSPRSMTEILEMVTKRVEITQMIEVKTDD